MSEYKKKPIEVAPPLNAINNVINKEAAGEKSIRVHGQLIAKLL